MRPILAFLLLLLAFGCTKTEGDYAVNCKFPTAFGGKIMLVVTDAEGEVLEKFDIPLGSSSFSGQFSHADKDALPEQYDLHLIYFYENSGDYSVNIFSHLDVPNGAGVSFNNGSVFYPSYRYANIQISDVESFDSLNTTEAYALYNTTFSPAEKKVQGHIIVRENHGLIMRMQANGEPDFRILYLPDSLLSDTISVSWQDFKPEEANIHEIDFSGGAPLNYLEVIAVSPDFKHATLLFQDAPHFFSAPHQVHAHFNHPAGVFEPAGYCIKIEQGTIDGYEHHEQYFAPGEPLHFEPMNMKIKSIGNQNRRLTIQTEGDIDLLRVSSYVYGNDNSISWQIDGDPNSFQNRALPNFRKYLPLTVNLSKLFYEGQVWAYQFDKYDYERVREGFPFTLNEPFTLARSGYKEIWKSY